MKTENPHAGQGMVVLDIGGDIGALVISAPAAMAGVEIEIRPSGASLDEPDEGAGWWQGEWRSAQDHHHPHGHEHHQPAWPHVAVLGRPVQAGIAYAAVFPGLRAGDYQLWAGSGDPDPDDIGVLTATVRGSEVTTASWPEPATPSGG